MRTVILAVWLISASLATAHAQTAGDSCRLITDTAVAYRQCLVLSAQAQSGDPFEAAMARAELMNLERETFDRQRAAETAPDFAAYGRLAPRIGGAPAPPAGEGCVILGDGLGGGIADCH